MTTLLARMLVPVVIGTSILTVGAGGAGGMDAWQERGVINSPPTGRFGQTAVWTGSEMIGWGGSNGPFLNDGGRYNPATNSRGSMTTIGAPAARYLHNAVWTGAEMIVWGGAYYDGTGSGRLDLTAWHLPLDPSCPRLLGTPMKTPLPTMTTRRRFSQGALFAGTGMGLSPCVAAAAPEAGRRIKVGVIGCGSVSGRYLPNLSDCPYVEVVSACDIRPERAQQRAKAFKVPNSYPHLEAMLAGAPFDFLVNLTDMQEHEHLNRQALEAGKHVWSEKPIANSLAAGQELLRLARQKNLRLWGAPIPVQSPQFAFMAKTLASGALGRVAAASAFYGHQGPDWSSFFYEKGGGSMPDLGVYNLTTLTGLLGPAKAVSAMLSIVTPQREITGKGKITVTEEDNAMLLLDHGRGVISNLQCGFNYFNPNGHDGSKENRHTVSIVGSEGYLGLIGYDWEPLGVDVSTSGQATYRREATDAKGYLWQQGAALAAECLATGRELLATPEHALHVLEIICAARESQTTGRRIALTSTFKWPLAV